MLAPRVAADGDLKPDAVQLLNLRNNRGATRQVYFFTEDDQSVFAVACFGDCDNNVVFRIDHALVD